MSDRIHASNRTLGVRVVMALAVAATACSHRPPADYAPDPGLLSHIRDIEISVTPASVCPGGLIQASYQAVIDDGTRVPFIRSYDKKHPPRLHVSFLSYTSLEASGRQDGTWVTSGNPIVSATTGFRLTVTMSAKPSVTHTIVVPPDYSCAPHAFSFNGEAGGLTQSGANGPDLTVRLGMGRSPFYDKLLIVGIEAGVAPPFYALYDARAIPPADFLGIEARGGRGGGGSQGTKGSDGQDGTAGCPAQAGGAGGDGGNGGPGASGGRGGRVTIIVPADQPFLAGLVDVRSPGGTGGPGGPGGPPGAGGKGGRGAAGRDGQRCADGADGTDGRKGNVGPTGRDGPRGPRGDILTVPGREVFGPQLPPELRSLLRSR